MSYFTQLQIGICNAWTIILFLHLYGFLKMLTNKKLGKRLTDISWYTLKEKINSYLSFFMMFVIVVFSVWVPLKINTLWFYAGMTIFIIGFLGNMIAMCNYAATPEDEPVIKGIYRFSRNPLYFFHGVMVFGACVGSASLFLLILWVLCNIPTHFVILGEERYCLETYGNDYKKFMDKVPRYCLFF